MEGSSRKYLTERPGLIRASNEASRDPFGIVVGKGGGGEGEGWTFGLSTRRIIVSVQYYIRPYEISGRLLTGAGRGGGGAAGVTIGQGPSFRAK